MQCCVMQYWRNEFDIVGIEINCHGFDVVHCWFILFKRILIKIKFRPIVSNILQKKVRAAMRIMLS